MCTYLYSQRKKFSSQHFSIASLNMRGGTTDKNNNYDKVFLRNNYFDETFNIT